MKKIGHDITPQPKDDESSGQAAARTSSVSSLSSTASSSLKKRKRSTTNGGLTSMTTETIREPDLSSRKEPAFEDPNNPFLVQAHTAETEIDESELGSSTQGRVRSIRSVMVIIDWGIKQW
ncbi:hypothetical protein BGZ74_007913 [Mortierella antarctica]|nr:hypothetical protein BGZ74_007913 [Mortierella antarctica]